MTRVGEVADQAGTEVSVGDPATGDLRLLGVAVALWLGVLGGIVGVGHLGVAWAAAPVAVGLWAVCRRADGRTAVVLGFCVVGGVVLGAARAFPVETGPVARLAAQGAYVQVEASIAGDAVHRSGTAHGGQPGEPFVVVRLLVDEVTGRGQVHDVRSTVVAVVPEERWSAMLPGQGVSTAGRLSVAAGIGPEAALLRVDDVIEPVGQPSAASRWTEPLRAGLRTAVTGESGEPSPGAALVPALVVGDESLMTDETRAAMQTAGLTHLTAVSGTNVTIVLVVVLGLARLGGVRGYLLPVCGAAAVGGFVLLARPEPSVVRAAVMGVVAVIGVVVAGRRRGLAALAAAVGLLLLLDPWLAVSPGFVLSVLATGGILALTPRWQRSLSWLPRPVAIALAVPLAAQVACTPVVVALSDAASVVSLPANIAAAPAVAPATVLGVAAAGVAPLSDTVARALGWLATLPATWIVRVAQWGAEQPGATVDWPGGWVGVGCGVVAAAAALIVVPRVFRRPVLTVLVAVAVVVATMRPLPTPGWPPRGWVAVACDVGQGDSLVLRAGPGAGVVVDAGPDPPAVQRCLDALGIQRVPLLVLTHFHADHVLGLPGVLAGRSVGRVLVSPIDDPPGTAHEVKGVLADAGVVPEVAEAGARWRVGAVELEALWPRRLIDSGESVANNASVVLAATVAGVDLLLTGDVEPAAQAALRPLTNDVDVLKVPHHGSAHQDAAFLDAADPQLALISVGENSYGHPAAEVVRLLRAGGAEVLRTDLGGSIAVVCGPDGGLAAVPGGPRARAAPRRLRPRAGPWAAGVAAPRRARSRSLRRRSPPDRGP